MRKWILTFAMTVTFGNLLAIGLKKLMPETVGPIFESLNANKLSQLFDKPQFEENKNNIKHSAVNSLNLKPAQSLALNNVNQPPAITLTQKENQTAPTKEDEKKRRKKRKKKEEKAHDKKPTLSVTTLGQNNKKKSQEPEYSIGSIVNNVPAKKEIKPIAPVAEPIKTVDLKQWIKTLTDDPSTSNLKKFVGFYKNKEINSKQYYSVLDALVKAPNKESRRLSILGSSIEPHIFAFEVLAQIKHQETDTELLNLANARLLVYKDIKYLDFLLDPIRTGDVFAKIEAISLTGQIVSTFTTQTVEQLSPSVKNTLNIYVSLLKSFSQNSNAQLQSLSQQTLSVINSVLGFIA